MNICLSPGPELEVKQTSEPDARVFLNFAVPSGSRISAVPYLICRESGDNEFYENLVFWEVGGGENFFVCVAVPFLYNLFNK